MSEHSQNSQIPEPDDESSIDKQRSGQNEPNEQSGSLPPEKREQSGKGADRPVKRSSTGSFLRRITGSLYRITGSLGENPPSSESFSNKETRRDQDDSAAGLLDELRASLPVESTEEPDTLLSTAGEVTPTLPEDRRRITEELGENRLVPGLEESSIPPDDLRRMTDELDFSHLAPGKEESSVLPEDRRRLTDELDTSRLTPGLPGKSEISEELTALHEQGLELPAVSTTPQVDTPIGQDTDLILRRMTGPFARDTDQLEEAAQNLSPLNRAPELTPRDTGELPPLSAEDRRAGEDVSPRQNEERVVEEKEKESPNLIRRITGSLRRVTGALGTAPLRSGQQRGGTGGRGEERQGVSEEKPKRDTGPLGSLLTGILRGSEGEKKEPRPRPPDVPDYVSEIRQDLVSDELTQAKKPKPAGNFLQRLTGGLRRATGSLGHTGQMVEGEAEKAAKEPDLIPEPTMDLQQAEIEDVLIEDRLAETAPVEPPVWAEPEDIIIELEPSAAEESIPVQPVEPLILSETETQPEPGSDLTGEEPISLLDSGAIAALGKAEEETRQEEGEPDWMAEIRQETAEETTRELTQEQDKHRGVTSPLRDFLSGIFRTEEKEKTAAEPEVSDDLVTGRIGKSLGIESEQEQAVVEMPDVEGVGESIEGIEAPAAEEETLLEESELPFDSDATFLQRFETAGFSQTAEEDTAVFPPYPPLETKPEEEELPQFEPFQPLGPADTRDIFTISPEDEKLLWGGQEREQGFEGRPPGTESWEVQQAGVQEEAQAETSQPVADDAYAAAYLTGAPLVTPREGEQVGRRRVTGRLNRERTHKPFEDIRSALLGDYQIAEQKKTGDVAVGQGALEQGTIEYEEGVFAPSITEGGLRPWLAGRTTLQKIILIEILLVILALLIVIPLFFIRFYGGQNQGTIFTPAISRSLPEDLPYPTGLTLPGGWGFNLEKSTFVNNQWSPSQSEWLEGTELRRVVAIPWNPQSEAVVQTFQPGDEVQVALSNGDQIIYKVDHIDRVGIEDTSIYSDRSPSLVIILFKEDAQERWVVFCNR